MPGDAPGGDLGFVFIVTYGRSGSTLLSGILNSIPGYLIRGENNDALYHLFQYHQTLITLRGRAKPDLLRQKTHPFYGAADIPLKVAHRRTRRLVVDTLLRPKPGTRVVGYKEIRWYRPDIADYVAWMREVFPGARFVINTRNHEDVLKSGWWANGDHAEGLAKAEERMLDLASSLGSAAYRVHYDDYVADPTVLRGLYDWLGEEFDEPTVRQVLAKKHSV